MIRFCNLQVCWFDGECLIHVVAECPSGLNSFGRFEVMNKDDAIELLVAFGASKDNAITAIEKVWNNSCVYFRVQ